MPKYQAELLYPKDFDEILGSEPAQIWFVDRPAEYIAALAHTAGRQMDTQLIEFQTAAFNPETAVIADEKGLGDADAEPPVYPWVCRYPGVWVLVPWGEYFHQYDDAFMTMVTVTMADGDHDIHPDPQLVKIPIPPKMDYTNIDLCMCAYHTGDGWALEWGYKETGDTYEIVNSLADHPDFNGDYEDAMIGWPFRENDWVNGHDLRAFGFEIV